MNKILIGIGALVIGSIVTVVIGFIVGTIFGTTYLLLKNIKKRLFSKKNVSIDESKVINMHIYKMEKILKNM